LEEGVTINELLAIVPQTLWDESITIEYADSVRKVPVQSVKVDTVALHKIALVLVPHFLCPRCGRTSFNPTDQAQRYCGACHIFFGDVPAGAAGFP
jgi:ribosomal protein S27AE